MALLTCQPRDNTPASWTSFRMDFGPDWRLLMCATISVHREHSLSLWQKTSQRARAKTLTVVVHWIMAHGHLDHLPEDKFSSIFFNDRSYPVQRIPTVPPFFRDSIGSSVPQEVFLKVTMAQNRRKLILELIQINTDRIKIDEHQIISHACWTSPCNYSSGRRRSQGRLADFVHSE